MNASGNTILITGGGSGIGRGLAEAFHAAGNQVIIAGRRQEALDQVTQANPGMKSIRFDVQDTASIRPFAAQMASSYPKLNVLINNAGIMRREDLLAPLDDAAVEAIIATNLLGPIRLTSALLPLLRQQPHSTVMNVSSGLAFVPMALTPTYCATKAAIHSYTLSLRYQFKGTTTEVLELVPPYVATELLDGGTSDPRAMPLDQFIKETMAILRDKPGTSEICVETVNRLRRAAEKGTFDAAFNGLNDAAAASGH